MVDKLAEPERNAPAKVGLAQFVEDNSKLITSIAVFIALTAFGTQLKDVEIQSTLPGVTLIAACLLTYELLARAFILRSHWRLEFFQIVLMMLLVDVGLYWFKTFTSLWVPLLNVAILSVGFFGPTIILFMLVTRLVKVVAIRLLHRHVTDEMIALRLPPAAFFFSSVVVVLGWIWVLRKHGPITIHVPF
jgi:hypothetical protein